MCTLISSVYAFTVAWFCRIIIKLPERDEIAIFIAFEKDDVKSGASPEENGGRKSCYGSDGASHSKALLLT